MVHTCHARGCKRPVPPEMLMCGVHEACARCGGRDFVLVGKNAKRRCRPCRNAYARRYLPKHRKYQRARLERDPAYFMKQKLHALYGMTLHEYEAMVNAQGGLCAVCGRKPKRRLGVDHDHVTGCVRALLCISCNAALGHVENKAWLHQALAYLERHEAADAAINAVAEIEGIS